MPERQLVESAASARLFDEYAIDTLFTALTNLPDPDETLQKAGIHRSQLRSLLHDDEIMAAVETRRDALVSTAWRLEPYEGKPSEFVWDQLSHHMQTIIEGCFNARLYGYSVMETVYERQPGRIAIQSISEKPLEWFQPTRAGGLLYRGPIGGHWEEVDVNAKFLLTRASPTYRNPCGQSLLSRLYWAWYFRHNAWRFWMQFLERFGEPLITGQAQDPGKFVEAVQGLGIENVIATSESGSINAHYHSSPGEFERVEQALGRRVQKLVLGQTLTSEVAGGGSYAAAKVHDMVREDKRNSDIRLVAPTIQRLVDALWFLNRFPGPPPVFIMEDGKGLEADRAERDTKLSGLGVRFTKQYFLDRYDLEEEDFDVRDPVAPVPLGARKTVKLALTQDQQDAEALADLAISEAGEPIDPELIRDAVLAARDENDLRDRLAVLLGHESAQYTLALQRALAAADVLGYLQESR